VVPRIKTYMHVVTIMKS